MNARTLRVFAALCISLTALGAAAQEDGVLESAVVRNRLYKPAGHPELSLSVGLPVQTYLTAHYFFDVGLAYNLFDTFAVEARAGFAASRHTGLARSISESFLDREDKRVTDELEDLWRMNLHGVIGARWAPIYGKISLVADIPVHFQTYLWVGGGLGNLKRESVIQCTQVVDRAAGVCDNRTAVDDRGSATENYWVKETRVAPVVSAALGFRFFIKEQHGIRLELRDWIFKDSYRVNLLRDDWEAGNPTGEPAGSPGLTHLVQFDLGYTYSF
ncbi:outer membrane beta-barrel domain-containing protein [Corallococcus praedator]|uniref:Outer membrane beta-barrel domain-containing protein n=1 Tax=Corallococcus praedator TaxID=2316724 RepID=A0ABX9QKG8_9BACT|nr:MULTISPECIES: outer membrane beta-barrel domain-containing protein [Corallococcus]RKH16051.1 outer membrane beta-barrel domain-containing protein [Corallococcus sp. CA047B]RKH30497.1 outer membrane beta-barrel domain-containing protein [Corallococcus sp. CA031C]RKI08491.1 outer membrane beta-barrel domain-containing protein [Corallococcus praedator]